MMKATQILEKLNRNKKKVFRIAVILFAAFLMLFSDFGYMTTIKLIFRINNLENKIEVVKKTQDSLLKRQKILYSDSSEIERIAREHYGLIKKGEEVFITN